MKAEAPSVGAQHTLCDPVWVCIAPLPARPGTLAASRQGRRGAGTPLTRTSALGRTAEAENDPSDAILLRAKPAEHRNQVSRIIDAFSIPTDASPGRAAALPGAPA